MPRFRDWRNPEQYDFTETLSIDGWAWEFLRRNDEYHKEYHARLREYILSGELKEIIISNLEVTNSSEASFHHYARSIYVPPVRHDEFMDRWKLERLVNPDEDAPRPNPFWRKNYGAQHTPEGLRWYRDAGLDERIYPTMSFDLTKPLKPQVDHAYKILLAQQDWLVSKGKVVKQTTRNQFSSWRNYLRAFDGKHDGASYDELARAIYPKEDNSYERRKPASEKIRKEYKQAQRLVDGGYKEYLMA